MPRRMGPQNPRSRKLRGQAGATPYKNKLEQEAFGSLPEPSAGLPRPPRDINSFPNVSRADLNRAVDDSSQTLSPGARDALRNALTTGNDADLLDWRPTNTSWPGGSSAVGPRTLATGYDEKSRTLFVRFRGQHAGGAHFDDGVGYEYYNVSPDEWRRFRDNPSPGRYINDVLNGKPYTPATW